MNNDDIDKNSDLHDPELHDKAISALYRQLPDEEPSSDTDALIRAAARRAVGAAPQKKLFTARVQGLLATAATLVLGVALVVQWRSEPQHLQEVLATAPQASAPPAAEIADKDAALPATTKAEAAAKPLPEKKLAARNDAAASGSLGGFSGDTADALFEEDAARPAPAEMKAYEAESRAREMAADALKKKSAEASSRKEENLAGAAPRNEALRSSARLDEYQPAPVAAAPASISAAPKMQADIAAEKAKAESTLLPYQQAMQAGHWAEAESLLGAAKDPESVQQLVDRDLLTRAQNKNRNPACATPPANSSDALLCSFIILHREGKALPADALSQLEKSGALSGPLAYRRAAILKLLEKP
ncbi:MAG: hypothetical protein REI12_04480 [Pedobacter sp.]|nr:hypothetical protein [Pedobacter sp.]